HSRAPRLDRQRAFQHGAFPEQSRRDQRRAQSRCLRATRAGSRFAVALRCAAGAPVVARRYVGDEIEIRLKGSGVRRRFAWVVSWQDRESGEWETEVLPVTAKSYRVSRDSAAFIAVTAVDRAGQESRKTILEVRRRR